jgi:predicted O-methyltransferase YrrM
MLQKSMLDKFKIATKYIIHYSKSYNRHGIHSPFVYQFLEDILYADKITPELKELAQLKKQLSKDYSSITITDLGAGSTINSNKSRYVKDVAKNSSKSAKYGRLFYRMMQHYQPRNIIELGTSLGLSAVYFAKSNPETPVYTLEGCPNTLEIAKANFNNLNIKNITPILGDFNETLTPLLKELKTVDFVFFDGNHQELATLDYFEKCLPYINDKTIFIFDDIHWSEGMIKAWNEIKGHPKTVVTLDLFFLGIVFFDSRLTEQDFDIKF